MRAAPTPIEEQYRLVLACRQSGMSDYLWCQENGIKPGTFYNWVKRLRKTGRYDIPAAAGRDSYKPAPKQDVVRVSVVEEPSVEICRPSDTAGSVVHPATLKHSIEIHIGKASISVANDADPLILSGIIRILHGGEGC